MLILVKTSMIRIINTNRHALCFIICHGHKLGVCVHRNEVYATKHLLFPAFPASSYLIQTQNVSKIYYWNRHPPVQTAPALTVQVSAPEYLRRLGLSKNGAISSPCTSFPHHCLWENHWPGWWVLFTQVPHPNALSGLWETEPDKFPYRYLVFRNLDRKSLVYTKPSSGLLSVFQALEISATWRHRDMIMNTEL